MAYAGEATEEGWWSGVTPISASRGTPGPLGSATAPPLVSPSSTRGEVEYPRAARKGDNVYVCQRREAAPRKKRKPLFPETSRRNVETGAPARVTNTDPTASGARRDPRRPRDDAR